jgi:serine/threonine protein kinase/tetratricopeptide (TPR) repeat protein
MDLQKGQTVARYRLVEPLGEGGMGVVWRAEDTELHRPVALKFLPASTLTSDEMRARFIREARTAASLNHPGICTIYEVGEHEGAPFIAMELIEGTTLDRRLRGSDRLPLSEVRRIATQVAEGMAAAHARGIVHRDLKPGNVMFTDEGRAKIVDFGLAKPQEATSGDDVAVSETISAEMTREGRILGTVSYMSPEQAQNLAVDSRSDVFSFGILLYQLASGRLPFQGETTASTLAKILETEPDPLSQARDGLPPELERIVRRCLSKRPEDRYNDTRDLVAALRDLQTSGEATAVAPATPARRWPWILAATVLMVIVALVLAQTLFDREEVTAPAPAGDEVPSVAVLPFHNLSADPDNEYFSAGMTEEIISKLSRIDGLEVASRGSVSRYRDVDRDVQQISDDLGVRYLLEGSVRRAGDRVRVSTQLVDGSTGRNLWSEQFDGSLDDVFAMQEQTALKIVEKLDLELTPDEQRDVQQRSTENVQAYDAYLRAMAALRDWSDLARLNEARGHLERALEYDADYGPALAGLAGVEAQVYRNFDSSEERIVRAEQLAERALALDVESALAHMTLGQIAGVRYDYKRAAQLLREAVRIGPKEPLHWDLLSWVLAYQTPPDPEGALDAANKALELQPDFTGALYHRGRALLQLGRHEEALADFDRALELNPDFSAGRMGRAQYFLAIGDYVGALAALDDAGKDSALNQYYAALAYAAGGETNLALTHLEASLEAGYRDFAALDAHPHLATLRDDPRYRDLIRKFQK